MRPELPFWSTAGQPGPAGSDMAAPQPGSRPAHPAATATGRHCVVCPLHWAGTLPCMQQVSHSPTGQNHTRQPYNG
jgi:hypothetical protein